MLQTEWLAANFQGCFFAGQEGEVWASRDLKLLLEDLSCDVEQRSESGETALALAVRPQQQRVAMHTLGSPGNQFFSQAPPSAHSFMLR